MKQLKQDELYRNLSAFLKAKGITLKEGSYSRRIRQGCGFLTDAINVTQESLQRARTEVDRKVEQMRQVIQKKTRTATSAPPPTAKRTAARKQKPAAKTPRKQTRPRNQKQTKPKRRARA